MHENGDWEMEIEGSKADLAWLHKQSDDHQAA